MTCHVVKVGGFTAIVCGPRERRRYCRCGARATLLCDHPKPKGGACDMPLCARCAVEVGEDLHHCPDHPSVPRQGSLAL